MTSVQPADRTKAAQKPVQEKGFKVGEPLHSDSSTLSEAGFQCTFSSGINALAANTVEDLLARPLKRCSEVTATVIAKMSVVGYGCISLGLAYLMKNLEGPVSQLANSAISAFGSPVVGVFFLAASFPRCNTYGAGGGIVVGSVVSLTVALGSTLHGAPIPSLPAGPTNHCDVSNSSWTHPNVSQLVTMTTESHVLTTTAVPALQRSGDFSTWDISYLWFSVIGFWTTFIAGIIISIVTGWNKETDPIDPKLVFPFCRKLYRLSDPTSEEEIVNGILLKGYQTETTNEEHEEIVA